MAWDNIYKLVYGLMSFRCIQAPAFLQRNVSDIGLKMDFGVQYCLDDQRCVELKSYLKILFENSYICKCSQVSTCKCLIPPFNLKAFLECKKRLLLKVMASPGSSRWVSCMKQTAIINIHTSSNQLNNQAITFIQFLLSNYNFSRQK